MDIQIKKLTPELINDYIAFFDNVAFTDNDEWAGCYCVFYHWNDLLETERKEYTAAGGKCFKRDLAIKFIQDGILHGYLAYVDGTVVGWCNTNEKASFDALRYEKWPEIWEKADSTEKVESTEKVKSIVCFTIAPHMRQKGIATDLLSRVCKDASEEGYAYVEAYPGKDESNIQRNYHGPYTLYEKNGFSPYKDLERDVIVRKYL
jgi:GNAT superfamily N-acetyltransferase